MARKITVSPLECRSHASRLVEPTTEQILAYLRRGSRRAGVPGGRRAARARPLRALERGDGALRGAVPSRHQRRAVGNRERRVAELAARASPRMLIGEQAPVTELWEAGGRRFSRPREDRPGAARVRLDGAARAGRHGAPGGDLRRPPDPRPGLRQGARGDKKKSFPSSTKQNKKRKNRETKRGGGKERDPLCPWRGSRDEGREVVVGRRRAPCRPARAARRDVHGCPAGSAGAGEAAAAASRARHRACSPISMRARPGGELAEGRSGSRGTTSGCRMGTAPRGAPVPSLERREAAVPRRATSSQEHRARRDSSAQ